eukprot:scaffold14114_cov90-Isochrysis_galbana.AAC.2
MWGGSQDPRAPTPGAGVGTAPLRTPTVRHRRSVSHGSIKSNSVLNYIFYYTTESEPLQKYEVYKDREVRPSACVREEYNKIYTSCGVHTPESSRVRARTRSPRRTILFCYPSGHRPDLAEGKEVASRFSV